jgi:hypothetical protein
MSILFIKVCSCLQYFICLTLLKPTNYLPIHLQAWFASSPLYIFTPYREFYFYCRISTTSYPYCQSTPAHGHLTCLGAIAQLLTTLLHMGQNCDHFNLGTLAIKTNIMKSSPSPSSFSGCLTIFPFTLSFCSQLVLRFLYQMHNCFFTLIFCSQFCLTFLLTMHTFSFMLSFVCNFSYVFIFQCTICNLSSSSFFLSFSYAWPNGRKNPYC